MESTSPTSRTKLGELKLFECENPSYSSTTLTSTATTADARVNDSLRQLNALCEVLKGLEVSSKKDAKLATTIQALRATIDSCKSAIGALDEKTDTTLSELKMEIDKIAQEVSELSTASESDVEDFGSLFSVVLTLDLDKQHTRGKSPDELRKKVINWAKDYVRKNNVTVVSGPWLDDAPELDQPHVNLTVRGGSREQFKGWSWTKGYVYFSPVVSLSGWSVYSKRNHETCTKLIEGSITHHEAALEIMGRTSKRKGKVVITDADQI